LAGETYVVSSREREHRHQADHVGQNRRDADAFYVDCDHDDRHADEFQTDADRMHDAIGDDFSAIVIPADLPRSYGEDVAREVVMTYGNSMILFTL
jgi:hypothetical protein